MAKDISTKAIVNNPDGSLFYRQEHEFTNCDEEMEIVLMEMLAAQGKFLDDLKQNQKKTPDAVFSAILSATGMPDLTYDSFTYSDFEKAQRNWNRCGETVLKKGEKRVKGKP